jgi:hypothetical protein
VQDISLIGVEECFFIKRQKERPMQPSLKLITAIKLCETPAYKIAWAAGVHPVTLSKLIHGAEKIRPNDPRIIRIGKELGLRADECFDFKEEGL